MWLVTLINRVTIVKYWNPIGLKEVIFLVYILGLYTSPCTLVPLTFRQKQPYYYHNISTVEQTVFGNVFKRHNVINTYHVDLSVFPRDFSFFFFSFIYYLQKGCRRWVDRCLCAARKRRARTNAFLNIRSERKKKYC